MRWPVGVDNGAGRLNPTVLKETGRSDDPHDQRAPVDTAQFRRVMGRFATGVTVITAEAEGGVRGMTANAFMSGSLTPPLCIISVAKKAACMAR